MNDSDDRDLRRLLAWEADHITGAPTEAEMVDRVSTAVAAGRARPQGFRSTPMLRVLVLAGLLAALVGGALAVGSWLQRNDLVFQPPLPTATPVPPPLPSPTRPPPAPVGSVPPGTYTAVVDTLTPFQLTVPPGWTYHGGFFTKGLVREFTEAEVRVGTGVAFSTWVITHVYVDSCQEPRVLREVGTYDLLVEALAEQTGHDTIGPTQVTFGGYPATRFEFSVPAAFDIAACSDLIRLWPDPGPDENGGEPIFPGQTTTIWVIDDDGRVTAAVAVRHVDSPAADVLELQEIVDSVQFWR